jgi:hypothetical protein
MKLHYFAITITMSTMSALFIATHVMADTLPDSQGVELTEIAQNPPAGASSTNQIQGNQIQGKTAGGESQTTVIDENGNLKIIDKSKQSGQTTPPPGNTTTPGMTQVSPGTLGPQAGAQPPQGQMAMPVPQHGQTPASAQGVPGTGLPANQAVPGQAIPSQAIPSQAIPGQAIPGPSGQAVQNQSMPNQPAQVLPGQAVAPAIPYTNSSTTGAAPATIPR